MKQANQTLEVLSPEVAVIPLEEKIENALVKANVTEKVLAEMKEKYGELRLKSIDDKESYLELTTASKEIRKIEIIAEKICKAGREDAIKEQKLWLKAEKDFLQKSSVIKNPLDADIKKFEDEVERKELLEAKKREEIYINRQSTLLKYGAQYNNGSFELKHISYEVELIKQADEEQWNDTILPKYRKVYEEIEAARVEEENKRRSEMEQARLEQEKFAEEQRKFKLQQEEFLRQQQEILRQKDELERKERDRKLQEQREIDAAIEKKWRSRLSQLNDIGWDGQYAFARFDGSRIFSFEELINLPDDIFLERAKDYINSLALFNKESEEKRLAQVEKEKQESIKLAAQQERERIQEEQRQAEIKKQQEANRKQQELEAAKDKEKYAAVVEYLKNYPNLVMTSTIYKGKMNIISDFINDL